MSMVYVIGLIIYAEFRKMKTSQSRYSGWVGIFFLLSLTGSEDMGIREDVPTSPIALQYDIPLPPVGRL